MNWSHPSLIDWDPSKRQLYDSSARPDFPPAGLLLEASVFSPSALRDLLSWFLILPARSAAGSWTLASPWISADSSRDIVYNLIRYRYGKKKTMGLVIFIERGVLNWMWNLHAWKFSAKATRDATVNLINGMSEAINESVWEVGKDGQ